MRRRSPRQVVEGWPQGPSRPPRPEGEVHVWRVDLDRPGTPAADLLPVPEHERALLLRRPEVRRRWVASRWALRQILGRYLDERPQAVRLRLRARGKPELEGGCRLRFSLGHSGRLALVALTEACEVGVDVESIDRRRDSVALAELALEADQAAAIREAPAELRDGLFHIAWTRKEAAVKCFGHGLGAPLPDRPLAVAELDLGSGYAAALAVAQTMMPARRLFELGP